MFAITPSEPTSAYLGVDLGTQGVRAVVLDGDGRRLGFGWASLRATDHRPLADPGTAGRHEQDPAGWWSAVCHSTRQALAGLENRPPAAIAIASTSGTVLVEEDGRAVGAALMYDDARAGPLAALVEEAGHDLWSELGYRMGPSFALPKIVWLVQEGRLTARQRVVHQADHIAARLVGHAVATDSSHALKSGVDLRSLVWPATVLDRLQVPVACLPEVVEPGTVLGHVCAAAADATDIPVGTPVRAGMTDGCAAQIAARALTPGSWSSALGTTLVIKGSTTELLRDPTGVVYSHRHPDGGWLPGGASNAGAGFIAQEFAGADLAGLTARAARFEPVPHPAYPLLGMGERFPFLAADAIGFGVDDADDGARFAAVLQGIALLERLAYDGLHALGADVSGPVTMSGGAAANRYWNQLRADVLGREVHIPESVEAAAGMAVLAAAPPGELGTTADRMVRITDTFQPAAARGARFEDSYAALRSEFGVRGWLAPGTPTGGRVPVAR